MKGQFTVSYNGEVIVEGENLIVTYGINETQEIKMPNEENRRNLKAQIDLLSDAHAELTIRAATANARILEADTRNRRAPGSGSTNLKFADTQLALLLENLKSQERRVARVRAEVEEIRKNLRTI